MEYSLDNKFIVIIYCSVKHRWKLTTNSDLHSFLKKKIKTDAAKYMYEHCVVQKLHNSITIHFHTWKYLRYSHRTPGLTLKNSSRLNKTI